MPLPFILLPAVAAGAPWIVRMAVKYGWGPGIVGIGFLLKSRLGLFIATAFIWLGINFASLNLVIQPTIDILTGFAQDAGSGGGVGEFAQAASSYMGILQFDRALTMIISAVITKYALLQGRLFLFKRGAV